MPLQTKYPATIYQWTFSLVCNTIHINANDHSTWISVFRLPAVTEKQFSSTISAALGFSEDTETHQKYPGKNYVHQQNIYVPWQHCVQNLSRLALLGGPVSGETSTPQSCWFSSHSFLHMSSSELLIMYSLQSNLTSKFACDTSHQITYNCNYVIMFLLIEMA